jgi:uncharacterized metal-binding protein
VKATEHLVLSSLGLKKRYGEDCTSEDADQLFAELSQLISSEHMQQPARKSAKTTA